MTEHTLIDLQPFCSDASAKRPHLEQPWSRDGFTYATDGRILLRVSREDYPAPENDKAPNTDVVGPYNHSELRYWIPVPELPEPEVRACTLCDGTGKTRKCRECSGFGSCECDCGHEHDCGYCDGTGRRNGEDEECECCEAGKITTTQTVNVGPALANSEYLRKIRTLPEVAIALPVEEYAPIAFRFEGGVGYLMPMRKGTEQA